MRYRPLTHSFLILVTFLATLLLYYGRSSVKDPTSWLFQPYMHGRIQYSNQRRVDIRPTILDEKRVPRRNATFTSHPYLCIAIPSVFSLQSLIETVGSLVHGLNEPQRNLFEIRVLIARTDPEHHPLYKVNWFRSMTDEVFTYADVSANTSSVLDMETKYGLDNRKSMLDYILALNRCYLSGAEYVAVLEDDVLARRNWLSILLTSLQDAKEQSIARGKWPFLYLRLFYTERYLGWNKEEWPAYLLYSVLLAGLACTALVFARRAARVKRPHWTPYFTVPMCMVYIFIYLPLAIIFFFALGRQTVAPLRRGIVEMPNFGCCTQGLVYPAETVPSVMYYLNEHGFGVVDNVLEEMAEEVGALRWAIVPSLLQHVGSITSIDAGGIVTDWIWNFAFEELTD